MKFKSTFVFAIYFAQFLWYDLAMFKQLKPINPIYLKQGFANELFLDDELVQTVDGKIIDEGDTFVNIKYTSENQISKGLSNLFQHGFKFYGDNVKSIEGVLQSLKHNSMQRQVEIRQLWGMDAINSRETAPVDWRIKQQLVFKNATREDIMCRHGEQYQEFLNALFLSLNQNPLFKEVLKCTGKKTLLHTAGLTDQTQTVLTRHEFEGRINALKDL